MASSPPGQALVDPYRTGAPGPSRRANRSRPSSHRRSRTPRGHWILVSLVVIVFAAGLMVEGYTRGVLGENSLWLLPLQQVVYRQLMYLVTIQSVITALIGTRQRWQAISRAGIFAGPSA